MKKILGFVFGLIFLITLGFAGCGGVYDNMEMVVLSDDEITIFIQDDVDGEGQTLVDEGNKEGEPIKYFLNTASIDIEISGVGSKVSKNILASSSDKTKLRIDSISLKDNVSTLNLIAIQPGVVSVKIQSVEGGQTKTLKVNIVQVIDNISIASDYKFAVMANGTPQRFDESKIIQNPANSSFSEFYYEAKEEVQGVIVSPNGYITATQKTANFVTIVIRPKYASNQAVFAEYQVPIFNEIKDSDLSLSLNGSALGDEEIEIIKNKDNENVKSISLGASSTAPINVGSDLQNLKMNVAILDRSTAIAINQTNTSFDIVGVQPGRTQFTVLVTLKDFPNVKILEKTYSVYVRDIATTISLASHNSNTFNVYNLTGGNSLGVEFIANVYPDTASNRKYKIQIPEEVGDKIKVTNAFGTEYDLSTALFTTGQKLYIYHDGTLINQTVPITLVSSDEKSNASLSLNLNLYLYIENIITPIGDYLYIYDDTLAENNYELEYTLNPVGANKTLVSIVSSNPNILEVEYSTAEETHIVNLHNVGRTKLYFYANGKLLKTSNVEVVSQLKAVLTNVDSPAQNSSISRRTRTSVSYGGMDIGQTTTSAVIKVGKKVKINISNYPESAKTARTEYSILSAKDENGNTIPTTSVSIDQNGYVRSTTAITKFYVVIDSYGYILDETTQEVIVNSEPIQSIMTFTAILPITDISLNAVYKEIYDINTVGYAEASLAQTKLTLSVFPTNATVDTSAINWSIIGSSLNNILEVQPDGSAIIIGRLPSNSGNQATITVRATIQEYDVVMSRECTVVIKKANQVSNILLENYNSSVGAYLKYSNLTGNAFIPDTYQIQATAMPLDATNSGLDYFAFDIERTSDEPTWFKDGAYTKSPSQRITVNSAGIVSTKSGAQGGYSIVYVVPRDNISEEGVFKESEIKKAEILLFNVADGTQENPFQIKDINDFLLIKNALDAHYVLANNINLAGISDFEPIGSIENPFIGHLSGELSAINGSKLKYSINNFNINVEQTQYADISDNELLFGLFGCIGNDGVVENLNITVSSINISTVLKKDLIFGVVSAYNYGNILNCEVKIKNDVEFNLSALGGATPAPQIAIGMLVGVNEGVINDENNLSNSTVVCSNDCEVKINDYDISLQGQTIDSISNGAIGGLVGLNEGSIYGVFKYSGDLLEPSQTYDIEFNVDYNQASINSNVILTSKLGNIPLGGVVGYNNNLVKNVSFAGSVSGVQNVGGVIGINSATASHLLSYGYIQNSLDNVNVENIGGVVGHNTSSGSISFAMFEVYETTTHINIQSTNVQNVGGVVGYNQGAVIYSYSYSYPTQKKNNTNFDINVSATNLSNIGGFVGYSSIDNAQESISISFSNVAIHVNNLTSSVGNFAGSYAGNIKDCYSIGYINEKPASISQTQTGYTDSNNWTAVIAGRNFDLPMLKIGDANHSNEVLLTEAPKELTISAKDGSSSAILSKRFYKVSDKQVILMLNIPVAQNNEDNTYALSDLISVNIVPLSNRTRSLIAEVISGNSISIVGGNVIAIGEGLSTIKIYSKIDSTICDILEVYVVKGITEIFISNADENNSIRTIKGQNSQLNIQNSNGVYQSLSRGGWRYTFNAENYAGFNYQVIDDVNNKIVYVNGEYVQLLSALEATTELVGGYLEVKISPYISAQFGNGIKNFVLEDIEYTLKLYIYQGLQGISLNKTNEQIMPSADGLITVTLNTDLESDFVNNISLYGNSLDNKLGDYTVQTSGVGAYVGTKPKFTLEVFSTSFDSVNSKRTIVFRVIPFRNIGDFEEPANYIFEFVSENVQLDTTYKKQYDLTIYPQEIQSATIKYFNDSDDFDANLKGAGEIETNKIIIGQYGLVRINLHPIYSVYSKLTIESSAVSGEVASFQQVYFNSKEDNYAERVMGSTLIDSGITLIRVSNKYKDDSNKYITNFDGNIYVKVLIGSNVVSGQTVVFTLNAYDENENVIYTTNIRLITESLPYLTIDLTSGIYEGLVAKGTDFYANVRYEYGTTYSLEFYNSNNSNGNPINNVDWGPTKTTLQNGIYTDLLQIHTNNLTLGEKYTIIAKITQSTGQDTKKIQVSTEFKVVNFVITGITLMLVDDNSNVETEAIVGGKFSYPLKNSGYNLKIRLITISDGSDAVNAQIAALETAINNRNVWQYFNLASSQFESIIFTDSNKEFAKTNFRLVKIDEGGWTLIGNSIANVDTLKAVLTYKYNNGEAIISTDSEPEFWQELSFELNFTISSSKEHPLPITTKEEFLGMQEGIDYILLEDIDLSNEVFEPISTKISSLDGNGKKIILSNFDDEENGNSIKIGLFSEVQEGTILKNIIIQVKNNTSLDLSNYSDISFGYIAGVNYGTITNAEITSKYADDDPNNERPKYTSTIINSQSSQQATINAYIGGLVGKNYGVITNSRVDNIKISTSGTLGGFVSLNNGIISSSYTNKVVLSSSAGDVGGFVAVNSNVAKIFTSYAKGEWNVNSQSLRADMLSIDAIGNAGGFIHTNNGIIRDCYSNLKLRSQSRSSGFVYSQNLNGSIENCISYCDIIQNSIAHMPFVATGTNNRFQNEGIIHNSFFYMTDSDVFVLKDIANNESGAQHLSRDEISNPSYLASFAFDDYIKGSGENTEYNGVWVIPMVYNEQLNQTVYTHFNTNNGFIAGVPELVDANIIAKSIKKLERTEMANGMPVYIYAFDYDNENVNQKSETFGSAKNPYLIADVDDFVYYFVENSTLDDSTNDSTLKNNKHIRLIKDISFSEYDQKLQTTKVEYMGIFNGNGLGINSISLSAEIGYNGQSFGLFNKLSCQKAQSGNIANRGVIKNLNVNFNEVKASQTSIVGGLVGIVDGGLLANITITGDGVAVKGSNIVGGVAGLVKGSARLFNINSKVSANAGYRNIGYKSDNSSDYQPVVYFDDTDYKNSSDYDSDKYLSENRILSNSIPYVSYAGAIAGIVDTKIRDNYQESLRYPACYDVTASGDIKIIASTAGGVFGMIGVYTTVSNACFMIENNQFINGEKIQGGVVGELRGRLEQSYIAHDDIIQSVIDASAYGQMYDRANTTLFKENAKTEAAGGLVGFNFGGSIVNCYAKVDVRNKMAQSAGGLIGASMSGDIRAVFASGSVTAYSNIGGLIGELVSVAEESNSYCYYNKNEQGITSYLPLEMVAQNGLASLNVSSIKFDSEKIGNNDYDVNTMTISYVVAGNNWYQEDISYNSSSSKKWGGIIGLFPGTLIQEYISTMHPIEPNERENLINFYVSSKDGASNQFTYGAVGNKELYIAYDIAYNDLKYSNKNMYFGSWHKYTWDLTNTGKFPILNPKVLPSEIEIATASDLMQVMWKLDGNYILVDDIDLSSVKSWLPLGTEQAPFCGTFNSKVKSVTTSNGITYTQYYTIKNLSISANQHKYYGLFGYTGIKETIRDNQSYYSQCVIKNINLTIKKIDSTSAYTYEVYVGALVACANGAYIENCTVYNSTLNNLSSPPGILTNSSYIGGLVGFSTISEEFTGYVEGDSTNTLRENVFFTSTIKNCASKVDIYVTTPVTITELGEKIPCVGGLVGKIYSETEISKSWSSQDIKFKHTSDTAVRVVAGGLVGANDSSSNSTISECFSSSNLINEYEKIENGNNTKIYPLMGGIMGGFIGELNSDLFIDHCFSSGKLRMVGTASTGIILGGFVGKLNAISETEIDNVTKISIMDNYSISTFENFVDGITIGGFIGDYSALNNNPQLNNLIENNENYRNFYDLSIAMLEEEGILFTTAEGIHNYLDEKWVHDDYGDNSIGNYYPLLKTQDIQLNPKGTLGNDRQDVYAFDSFRKGSKVNPILIKNLGDFENMIDNQERMYSNYINNGTPMDYNYYLQVNGTDNMDIDLSSSASIKFKDSDKIIEHFYGFYNGSNNTISNFKLTTATNQYNIGLFGQLMQDSAISCLSLKNVNIEIFSDNYIPDPNNQNAPIIDDSVLNVGGLVGETCENSTLFGITIDSASKVTVVPYGSTQSVNVGGIAGHTNQTQVIYCINYANIASFDYRVYNGINVSNDLVEPAELNMGSIVGLYDGSSEIGYKIVNVYSIGELHYTKETANIGNLVGKINQNIKLKNFYSVNTVFNQVDTLVSSINDYNSSAQISQSGKISIEFNEQTEFNKNYGYSTEKFGVLSKHIPTTATEGDNKVYTVITAPQLIYLLNANKNIKMGKNVYFNNELSTLSDYSAVFDGDNHTLFNLNTTLASTLSGTLKNIEIKKSSDSPLNLFTTTSGTAIIDNVSAPDFTMSLSSNSALYHFKNENSYSVDQNDNWIDLAGDGSYVIRTFVKYWDEIDLRCVFIRQDTTVGEETNEGIEQVSYFTINDKYQLSKLLKLSLSDSSHIKSGTKYAIHYSTNYDFAGKIWKGFAGTGSAFGSTLLGIADSINNRIPTLKNIYTEGKYNVGFICVASGAVIKSINFENSRNVLYGALGENERHENVGAIIGRASDTYVSDINVKGVDIKVEKANYVGGCFGTFSGTMENITIEKTANNSQIKGANYVGGIAGKFTIAKANDKSESKNFSNNYDVFGHDVVGGFFGSLTREFSADTINGNKTITNNEVEELGNLNYASLNSTLKYNDGTIIGRNFVGGIVGYSSVYISNVINNGQIKASGYFVGGISGYNNHVIHNSYNYNEVIYDSSISYDSNINYSNIGNDSSELFGQDNQGIVLSAINTFTDSTLKPGYFFGGISGLNKFYVSASKNFQNANISAKSFVGGIVGLNMGTITGKDIKAIGSLDNRAVNNSNVVGDSFVGGIAGYNNADAEIDSAIYNVSNLTNSLHAKAFVGGIAGYNEGWILNVSAQNEDPGSLINLSVYYVGGIAGYNTSDARIQSANSAMKIKLSGSQAPDMNNVLSIQSISYDYLLGGITAQNDGSIVMCASQGVKLVRASGFNSNNVSIGGISAVNNGKIELSFVDNTSSITFNYDNSSEQSATPSNTYVIRLGGAIAQNNQNGEIISSFSLASIEVRAEGQGTSNPYQYQTIIGGLVADNYGSMRDSYALNSVYGQSSTTVDYGENSLYYVIIDNSNYMIPNNSNAIIGYGSFLVNNFVLSSIMPYTNDSNDKFTKVNDNARIHGFDHYIASTSVWSGYTENQKLEYNQTFDVIPDDWFDENSELTYYTLKFGLPAISASDFAEHIVGLAEQTIAGRYREALARSCIFFHSWTNLPMPVSVVGNGSISTSTSTSINNMSSIVSSGFAGNGTSSDPYKIFSASDFATINYYLDNAIKSDGSKENFAGKYFKMMNDIILTNDNFNFFVGSEENPFAGTIDGDNHMISGLTINTTNNAGMFRVLGEGGDIKNIVFLNPKVTGVNNVGVVAGINEGTIEGIRILSDRSNNDYKVQGQNNVGAICGINEKTINSCQVSIDVSGDINVGSICGLNNGEIFTSETLSLVGIYSSSNYTTSGDVNIGGIVGKNAHTISECACRNSINGEENVGGIVGFQAIDGGGKGGIDNCLFVGDISSVDDNYDNKYFGGIIGNCISGTVSFSICAGTISGLGLGSGEIYGKWSSTTPLGMCITSTYNHNTGLINNSRNIIILSSNKMVDIVRRSQNFSGFDDSIWGFVPVSIDDTNHDYTSAYQYPLPRHLPSSKDKGFSYAVFNGAGTAENPYYIENKDQFDQLVSFVNSDNAMYNSGQHYKIDINVYKKEYNENQTSTFTYNNTWTPTNDWKCVLDGNGATITIDIIDILSKDDQGVTYKYSGLVSRLTQAGQIHDLTLNINRFSVLDDSQLGSTTSHLYVGSVAGLVTVLNYECNNDNHAIYNITLNISDNNMNGYSMVGSDSGNDIYVGRVVGKNATANGDDKIVDHIT